MLTPPGPTKQPMMIRTIPASTPPRMIHTMPAITRIAAMIHSSVATPPERAASSSIGSFSLLVRPDVPRDLRRGTGRRLPDAVHLFGRGRTGDLCHGLADVAGGSGGHRDIAERHYADQRVTLDDGQALDTVLGHPVFGLTQRLVGADRGDVLRGGDGAEVHLVRVEALREDPDHEVAVGHDADELLLL